jgi:hypothetical protein
VSLICLAPLLLAQAAPAAEECKANLPEKPAAAAPVVAAFYDQKADARAAMDAALADAAQAHRDLEDRRIMGSAVLLPF